MTIFVKKANYSEEIKNLVRLAFFRSRLQQVPLATVNEHAPQF